MLGCWTVNVRFGIMGSDVVLDKCPILIYKVLLGLIHSGILIYETIQFYYLLLWRWYVSTVGLNIWRKSDCSLESLLHDSVKLKKVPKHMGIIFTEKNDLSIDDISNLVAWAISFGVSYISLYEKEGHLLSYQDLIQKKISSKLKKLLGEAYKNYSLVLKDSSKSYDNGYIQTKGVCIQMLSCEDGMQDISNTTKMIINHVANKEIEIKGISASLVNDNLKATKGLPDPDLAIQFGRALCLNGFLPWQSRLTEFISFTSSKNICYFEFLKALRIYGDTKQRFGK